MTQAPVRDYDRIAVGVQFKISKRMYQQLWDYVARHPGATFASVFRNGAEKVMQEDERA